MAVTKSATYVLPWFGSCNLAEPFLTFHQPIARSSFSKCQVSKSSQGSRAKAQGVCKDRHLCPRISDERVGQDCVVRVGMSRKSCYVFEKNVRLNIPPCAQCKTDANEEARCYQLQQIQCYPPIRRLEFPGFLVQEERCFAIPSRIALQETAQQPHLCENL